MEVAVRGNSSIRQYRTSLPTTRVKLTSLNPHLICVLCGGYYIDATTIIECLHSFCRTCIIRYLETSKYCPICEVQVHKTRPLQHIRQDKTLQDLVYKLVPGLFKEEMKRRRDYFSGTPLDGPSTSHSLTAEGRGEVTGLHDRIIYTEDEKISLSLELSPNGRPPGDCRKRKGNGELPVRNRRLHQTDPSDQRFLLCPAAVSIAHLKKFIRMKFSLSERYMIDVYYAGDNVHDLYTLMDIAYIYRWKRRGPLRLYYTVYEYPAKKRRLISTDTDVSKEMSKEDEDEVLPSVSPPVVNGDVTPAEVNDTEPMDLVKKSPESVEKISTLVPVTQTNGSTSDTPPKPSPNVCEEITTVAVTASPREDVLPKVETPPVIVNSNNNNNNNNNNLENAIHNQKDSKLQSPSKSNIGTALPTIQESVEENGPINMVITTAVKKEPMETEETS